MKENKEYSRVFVYIVVVTYTCTYYFDFVETLLHPEKILITVIIKVPDCMVQ